VIAQVFPFHCILMITILISRWKCLVQLSTPLSLMNDWSLSWRPVRVFQYVIYISCRCGPWSHFVEWSDVETFKGTRTEGSPSRRYSIMNWARKTTSSRLS
jgi:hypothetical protein